MKVVIDRKTAADFIKEISFRNSSEMKVSVLSKKHTTGDSL